MRIRAVVFDLYGMLTEELGLCDLMDLVDYNFSGTFSKKKRP